jgi:hypothetical protein
LGGHQALQNPKKAKKGDPAPKLTRLTVVVAHGYPAWQRRVAELMAAHYTPATRAFADERVLLEAFKADEVVKKQMKRVMTFLATIKVRWHARAPAPQGTTLTRMHAAGAGHGARRRRPGPQAAV